MTDAAHPLPARRKSTGAFALILGVAAAVTTFAGALVAMNGGGWLVLGVGGVLLAATYAARQVAHGGHAHRAADHWHDEDPGGDDDAPWEPHPPR